MPPAALQVSVVQRKALPVRLVPKDRTVWLLSDTHIHPAEWFNIDDDVELLSATLRWTPADDQVVLLCDVTESMLAFTAEWFARALLAQPKTRELLDLINRRKRLRVVLGNHDLRISGMLSDLFGNDRVCIGPIALHRLLLLHGHEVSWLFQGFPGWLGRGAIPVLNPVERFARRVTGWHIERLIPDGNLDAAIDLLRLEAGLAFAVYGHRHRPGINGRVANTGCFLRTTRRTLIRVTNNEVVLLQVSKPEPPTPKEHAK